MLKCFKAYDIRGRLPDELNADIAYRIARGYAEFLKPKRVIVGFDIRLSSQELANAVMQGLMDSGVEVFDIGLCGTESVYFATFFYNMDGGIMITASHNPKDYNGMKLVREQSKPISGDTGLNKIRELAEKNQFSELNKGSIQALNINADYIKHLLSYINTANLKPLKIVVNAGNGGAGLIIDLLESHLKSVEFIKLHHEPNGEFPNGIANPLLPENRQDTINAILEHKSDLGIAWDGDFDRCFLFDETGRFIEGYYIVGLLAEAFLKQHPNEKIIHDPRLTWNTIDIIQNNLGTAIQSKTGHAFIKERMREENAIYGGEMSAHHYFRDFAYCDSGMIPWLLVIELISLSGKTLGQLLNERMALFPASGEINRTVENAQALLKQIEQDYQNSALTIDYTDGLSMEFENWRFNLRCSNTEPLLRLNVEARNNEKLMQEKTQELLNKL